MSSAPPRGASERDALRGRVGLRAMDQELVRGRLACAQRAMAFHALWLAFRQRFTSASALTYAMRTSSSLSCTGKHELSIKHILQIGVPCHIWERFYWVSVAAAYEVLHKCLCFKLGIDLSWLRQMPPVHSFMIALTHDCTHS